MLWFSCEGNLSTRVPCAAGTYNPLSGSSNASACQVSCLLCVTSVVTGMEVWKWRRFCHLRDYPKVVSIVVASGLVCVGELVYVPGVYWQFWDRLECSHFGQCCKAYSFTHPLTVSVSLGYFPFTRSAQSAHTVQQQRLQTAWHVRRAMNV